MEAITNGTGNGTKAMNANSTAVARKRGVVAVCGCDAEELKPVWVLLGEVGYDIHPAETIDQLDVLLHAEPVDAIIMQVCPSKLQFLPILGRPDLPPVIPLLRHSDKHLYMELLHRGAFDCVPLPPQGAELKRVLSLAIEHKRKQMAASNAA